MKCCGLEAVIIFGLIHYVSELCLTDAVESGSVAGSAIVCYECNSAFNSLCSDTFLPESLRRNCSDHDRGVTHTLCRKIIQHVDHEINGHTPSSRVIRSCGWDETKYKGSCYHRAGYGGRQEVCSCTTDLCNGTNTHASSCFLLAMILLFTLQKHYSSSSMFLQ